MQVIADVVITKLISDIGKKSQKPYYRFKGVIVGCQEFPVLSGISFDKFISEEVFAELSTLTQDRFDCSIGLSRASVNPKDFDLGFNLFINGFPKEPEEAAPEGNVSPSSAPEAVIDKSKEKGGKG